MNRAVTQFDECVKGRIGAIESRMQWNPPSYHHRAPILGSYFASACVLREAAIASGRVPLIPGGLLSQSPAEINEITSLIACVTLVFGRWGNEINHAELCRYGWLVLTAADRNPPPWLDLLIREPSACWDVRNRRTVIEALSCEIGKNNRPGARDVGLAFGLTNVASGLAIEVVFRRPQVLLDLDGSNIVERMITAVEQNTST